MKMRAKSDTRNINPKNANNIAGSEKFVEREFAFNTLPDSPNILIMPNIEYMAITRDKAITIVGYFIMLLFNFYDLKTLVSRYNCLIGIFAIQIFEPFERLIKVYQKQQSMIHHKLSLWNYLRS